MFNIENNNNNKKNPFQLLREKKSTSNVSKLLDNINSSNPHIFSSDQADLSKISKEDFISTETQEDIFGYAQLSNINPKMTNQIPKDKIFTIEELANQKNLSYFLTVLKNLKNKNGFVKLFTTKSDEELDFMINNTIIGRKSVTKRNNTKSDRENQEDIDIKSISSEAIFTDFLLKINKNHKYSIEAPELNTQTPNKAKTDYILTRFTDKEQFIFDMKSQSSKNSEFVNINGIAHKRMYEEQGLQFYIVGLVDYIDNVESIKKITYYYLPMNYFIANRKWVDTGKYAYDPKNHFWTLKLNVVEELNIFN